VRAETGEVFLSDLWADQDIHYPGDSWNDPGTNLFGNFKAIYNLKRQNRHLRVLLSIGGWTYSPSFHPVVVDPRLRAEFVRSAVALLEDYGLDGLDVDYEYPQNDDQARGYVELLRALRTGLDDHARMKNADYRFLLTVRTPCALHTTQRTLRSRMWAAWFFSDVHCIYMQIAAPCGPDKYQKLYVPDMDQCLDFWNLMAYDFCASLTFYSIIRLPFSKVLI